MVAPVGGKLLAGDLCASIPLAVRVLLLEATDHEVSTILDHLIYGNL